MQGGKHYLLLAAPHLDRHVSCAAAAGSENYLSKHVGLARQARQEVAALFWRVSRKVKVEHPSGGA